MSSRGILGSLVISTLSFTIVGMGSIPGLETKILHVTWYSQKTKAP